jgi:hypothetical protein
LGQGITSPSTGGAVEFEENVRLAAAAAAHFGVGSETALPGSSARPDFGGLKVWRIAAPGSPDPWYFASLFAANEPESSALALARLAAGRPGLPGRRIALLNLREDGGSSGNG